MSYVNRIIIIVYIYVSVICKAKTVETFISYEADLKNRTSKLNVLHIFNTTMAPGTSNTFILE